MTIRRAITLAIAIAVLAGILLGGLALTGAGSVVSKAFPSQLRGDDGESEPDENENEAPERTSGTSPSDDSSRANDEPDENEVPERTSGTSPSDDSSRANDEADEREPSEGGADEAERGNEP